MNKMSMDYGAEITNKELISVAVKAMNTQQRYGGHSPSQVMIGHEPDVGGQINPDGVRREIAKVASAKQAASGVPL